MRIFFCAAAMIFLQWAAPGRLRGAELDRPLKALLAVDREGAGHREAVAAWEQVARAKAAQLPMILTALDEANPLAANWIRTAVDAIAERELDRGGKLPAAALEQFVLDRRHAPRARRLAYEWLVRVDGGAPERLVPGMLDDPSLELRREAVARLIQQSAALEKAGQREQAAGLCDRAFQAARDLDQVRLLADRLRRAGHTVDLPRHFGFVVRWKVIGPFDNMGEKGYETAYPPEQTLDLAASYPGKHGVVKWLDHVSGDDYGRVDLNKLLGEEKAVVAYAAAEFVSPEERQAQLRLTSSNAVKLWLNGKLITGHNIYHAGSELDQYVSPVVLQPGRNVILVKVCQNAQPQDWARDWQFQLRVCDQTGTAVPSR